MGTVDGRPRFLHRMEDILMFRVREEDVRSTAGLFDCFLDAQVSYVNPASREAA
jgi:hypothetical protein